MDSDITLAPAIKELERAFHFFNARVFNNQIVKNFVITIQTKGRRSASGWFGPERWSNTDSKHIHEINISAEYLLVADPMEVLLHELCHQYNNQRGIKDYTVNQYHNRKFKETAEKAGLIVTQFENRGFARTAISAELQKIIDLEFKPQVEVFHVFRRFVDKKEKGSKLRKYTCSCGINVRVAKEPFLATCDLCGGKFERYRH
jgi:hypothetical protein